MKEHLIDFSTSEVLGFEEINLFTRHYRSWMVAGTAPDQLVIKFSSTLQAIDDLFYSYLLLLGCDFPQSKIVLVFEERNAVYGIATQQVAFLKLYGLDIVIKGSRGSAELLKSSAMFFPQLLIQSKSEREKKGLPDLFLTRDVSADLHEFLGKSAVTHRADLINVFSKKPEFWSALSDLVTDRSFEGMYMEYILSCLQDLDLLRELFRSELGEQHRHLNYKVANLTTDNALRYVSESLITLKSGGFFRFSYIEIFLFRVLLSQSRGCNSGLIFSTKSENVPFASTLRDFQRHLKTLLSFVKDLAIGLVELAKNINEHSGKIKGEGYGVISARILSNNKLTSFKYTGEAFEHWFAPYGKKNNHYFLDINVIDSGAVAVTNKYVENLNEEIELLSAQPSAFADIIRADYVQDVQTMTDALNPYNITDLLNYRQISLFHQVKRVNSRLGLLIFANLILNGKRGFVKVASNSLLNTSLSEYALLYINNHDELIIERFDYTANQRAFSAIGTSYNFIVPVEHECAATEERQDRVIVDDPTGTSSSVFKKLRRFRLGETEERAGEDYVRIVSDFVSPVILGKYEKIYAYRDGIFEHLNGIEKKIALIKAPEVLSFLENASDWMRFIASVQLIDSGLNLIIYDLPEQIHTEIIQINRLFDKTSAGFWHARYGVLFYLKITYNEYENGEPLSLWFNDLLLGPTFNDYQYHNREISRYHDNVYRITEHERLPEHFQPPTENTGIFFSEGKLLHFELLLRTSAGVTIFEDSVRNLLELEVHEERAANRSDERYNRSNFFKNLKGYKISRSHFRLGSKIHITDFFYAKRLFYNSFFSNRFAYLIADHIYRDVLVDSKNKESVRITLIGYSNYSELLVSNVRKLLNDWGYPGIRHDVVLENEKILRNAVNIHQDILLIIPISSTFTTSQKVKRIVQKVRKDVRAPYDDINALVIGNQGFTNPLTRFADPEQNELYESFGWLTGQESNTDPQVIEVEQENVIERQRFLLGFETNWQEIYNCKFCFEEEVCLLETEKNSVTPDLIFGLPVNRRYHNQENLFDLLKDYEGRFLVSHDHIKKNNDHYYFYIRTGLFLADPVRRKLTVDWLTAQVKNQDWFKPDITDKGRVIIVTPSLTSNSGFVNLVNEVLFMDTATVLQFNAAEDCLQNFVKFNGALLVHSRIIFVDDTISTGRSFWMVENFVRNVFNDQQFHFDLCLTLFNQVGFFDEQNILRYLRKPERFQFLAKLNMPALDQLETKFPFEVQMNTYSELAEKSTLDAMQMHFRRARHKVEPLIIDKQNREPNADKHSLLHFLLYHEIFNLFQGEYLSNFEFSYDHQVIDQIKSETSEALLLKQIVSLLAGTKAVSGFLRQYPAFEQELPMFIIRIFAEPPFVHYKKLKELAFDWVSRELTDLTMQVINHNGDEVSDEFFNCLYIKGAKRQAREFSPYNTFKLLLKLALRLKINLLLAPHTLLAMKALLGKIKKDPVAVQHYQGKMQAGEFLPDINDPEKFGITKPVSAPAFATYYVALIQELIMEDEAKAIQLVRNIVWIINTTKIVQEGELLSLRDDFENPFIQLLRLLVLENTFIFDTFFTNFFREHQKIDDYTLAHPDAANKMFFNFEFKYLRKFIVQYRFQALKLMLSKYQYTYQDSQLSEVQETIKDDLGLRDAFEKTIYLKVLLRHELRQNPDPATSAFSSRSNELQNKIKNMLAILCDILSIKNTTERGGGAYFAIRYKDHFKPSEKITPNDLYTIVNYYTNIDHVLNNNLTGEDSIAFKIFRGIKDKGSNMNKATFELMLDQHDHWQYRELNKDSPSILSAMELNGTKLYRNIFFLRLSELQEKKSPAGKLELENNPEAVIGFYRNPVEPNVAPQNLKRFDPKRVRFLLLLKDDINRFIKHHLSNDSFMAYVEQKEKESYIFSLKHGISTYRNAIRGSLKKLTPGMPIPAFKQAKEELYTSFAYMINKIHLMSLVTRQFHEDYRVAEQKFEVKKMFETFEKSYFFVLDIKLDEYRGLRPGEKVLFTSELKEEDAKLIIKLPATFFRELIFELIYNIRKHVLHDHRIDIDDDDPLAIHIKLTRENGQLYFVVENNHNFDGQGDVFLMNSNLNSNSNHGLNMINKIMQKNYGPLVIVKNQEEWLSVKIPLLKVANDHYTENYYE